MYCQLCLHAGGIIGSNFFENDITVNLARYKSILNDYLFQNLNGDHPELFWFQQDGAIKWPRR